MSVISQQQYLNMPQHFRGVYLQSIYELHNFLTVMFLITNIRTPIMQTNWHQARNLRQRKYIYLRISYIVCDCFIAVSHQICAYFRCRKNSSLDNICIFNYFALLVYLR